MYSVRQGRATGQGMKCGAGGVLRVKHGHWPGKHSWLPHKPKGVPGGELRLNAHSMLLSPCHWGPLKHRHVQAGPLETQACPGGALQRAQQGSLLTWSPPV